VAPGGDAITRPDQEPGMAILDLTRLLRTATLALLAALMLPVPSRAETAIRFTLDRKIDGPSAPFFLAIDKGYFKAEGLDVTITAPAAAAAAATSPAGPAEPISRLAAGSADMGVADLNGLIKFRDDNPALPIKALFVVFDKPPYAIIARKSRSIAAPKDLEGKKLGTAAADGSITPWPIFAKVNGIDAAKVVVETVGLPVREPMLAAGELDAITGCAFTSYVDLEAGGVPADDLAVLAMADYGVELYGDAIMAAPKFLAEKPEAARGFLRAYLQALKDTLRDPARAVEAVLRRNDAAKKDIELERLRLAIRDNIVTRAVKANGFGGVDPVRFAAAIKQLALAYRFNAKDKAADAFDPSFLPSAAEQ
jgi:NitT/TauT family transport system substrate-binding protein